MSLNIRRAFLTFSFLFVTASLARAEVRLDVEFGFHGLFKLGAPFPLSVVVTNLDSPLEGVVQVEVWKGGATKVMAPYPFYHRKEIFLAARSQRKIPFTVHPDSMARPLKVTFTGSNVELTREFDLRGRFSPSPLILLATGSPTLLAVPLAGKSEAPVVTLSTDELPFDAQAYLGVWAVVLYEQSFGGLSDLQRWALESWIHSGGRLVVLGGLHYALYQEPSLAALLPVRVAGIKEMADLLNLRRRYGVDLPRASSLWVQDATMMEGEVLISEAGSPILATVGRGRGKVFYLALDVGRPPMSRWAGLSLLFSNLLGDPAVRRPGPWTDWNDNVFSRFLSESTLFDTSITMVPFVVCLLFYVGGLSLLVWLWIRQWTRRIVLVAGFTALVLFATLGGYLYFERATYRKDGLLVTSNLLEGYPDGYAEVQSNVGLFATRRKDFKLQLDRGWSDLEMVRPRRAKVESPSMVIQEGMRSTGIIFPSREWNFQLFRLRSMRSFPVRIKTALQGDRLSIELINASDKDLTDCWLVLYGNGYSLGDIPRGSRVERELSISVKEKRVEGLGKRFPLQKVPFKEKARELLFRHSLFPDGQPFVRWSEQELFLFGWIENDFQSVRTEDKSLLSFNYSLFRTAVPLEDEEEL